MNSNSNCNADCRMSTSCARTVWRSVNREHSLCGKYAELAQQTLLQQRDHFINETHPLSPRNESARDPVHHQSCMGIKRKDMQSERFHRGVEDAQQEAKIMNQQT